MKTVDAKKSTKSLQKIDACFCTFIIWLGAFQKVTFVTFKAAFWDYFSFTLICPALESRILTSLSLFWRRGVNQVSHKTAALKTPLPRSY